MKWISLLLVALTAWSAEPTQDDLLKALREKLRAMDIEEGRLDVQVATSPEVESPVTVAVEPVPNAIAPASSGPAVVSAALPASEMAIGPGDVITISVRGEPDMGMDRVEVGSGGEIRHPIIGGVEVGGKTPTEAGEHLRAILARDYLVNPVVELRVLERKVFRIRVEGQVMRPGAFEFAGGETVSVFRAIGQAGGATRQADLSRVVVRRRTPDGEQSLSLDLEKLRRQGEGSETGFLLENGDLIIVSTRGRGPG